MSQILPVITSTSPDSGSTAGGTTVVLDGYGFTGIKGVLFGTEPASSWVVNADNQITVVSPPDAAATDNITVLANPGESVASTVDQFTFTSTSQSHGFHG